MKAYRTLLSRLINVTLLDQTSDKDLAEINVVDQKNHLEQGIIHVAAQKTMVNISGLVKAKFLE